MKERQSNIEVLRIVCMFLIVWVHFTGHCILDGAHTYSINTSFASIFPQIINGICLCAVNTFVLISGYFSIRPKAKSFISFYLMCAFYAGLLYLIHLYLTDTQLNRYVVYNTLMPFGLWQTSTNWWFIPNYMILYLLSPILNKIFENLSQKKFRQYLLILSIIVFYFGWYRNFGWSESGFNFINFVFIYLLGRYLAMYSVQFTIKVKREWYLVLWILTGVFIGAISWLVCSNTVSFSWMWFNRQYNSPLCMISAVCLFMAFKSMKMKNKKSINWFAASILPVYLVTDNNFIISQTLYKNISMIYDSYTPLVSYLIILAISIGIMICIPILDKIRILICNPLENILCKYYYRIKSKLKLFVD